MRNLFALLLFFTAFIAFSQSDQLGQNYYDRGEFDKALIVYEDLAKKNTHNFDYFQKLIACYQQVKEYKKAESSIQEKMKTYNLPSLYIELGYNYQLLKEEEKANKNYKIAIDKIKENPNNVYNVASAFEQKVLIEQAIEAYKLGMIGNPNANFEYQISLLQGQLGKTDLMIDTLLDYTYKYPANMPMVQNQFTRFMSEDTEQTFSEYLKKALLIRTQKSQEVFWNQFMSWFFVQQKNYTKAFIQEKAIFKRTSDNLYNIVNLAKLTLDDNETELAAEILNFIIVNTQEIELLMEAEYQLINISLKTTKEKDYTVTKEKIDALLIKYGISPNTIKLQILKAHFYAFYLKQFEEANNILKDALALPLNKFEIADVKMELADILLLNEKFNQAIIYYAQIEEDVKSSEIANEASFKMAKSSYYKGDFDWAKNQFRVLKSSTSQFIANDSMELFLLISDQAVEDSTHVALKKFARADFLKYQEKKEEAFSQYALVLKEHQSDAIAPITLLRIGRLYDEDIAYEKALYHYKWIIDKHFESIYIDEALFFAAEIYKKQMNSAITDLEKEALKEKAKNYYEKIIFNHEDSIYFVEARNNFRKLRGDTNL